jgi:hypothetical protein
MTTTKLVSVKNKTVLCTVLQTVFLCRPSCVNWRMSRNSATLARSGRVRTNLHALLCYHFTKHRSLHATWLDLSSVKRVFCVETKVHYHVYKSPQLVHILRKMNPVKISTSSTLRSIFILPCHLHIGP